ncbi:quinone oxidoreductase family protein [Winogradskya humida]|uniref:quinone oxidoreductase family protein n=1 Tax=Winogradskya humida TaxID=113566 RepID=UPI0019452597|nr:zinc-binding dehydrogenase [Actinoplanes humidus]
MRRVRFYEYGDPGVLTVEKAEIPEPGAGQVRIRVQAIGANFVDTRFRRGPSSGAIFERPLPGKLTGDVVGIVDKGDEDLFGCRVVALSEDAYADYVVVDAQWITQVPDDMDVVAASMVPTSAPVALRALRSGAVAAGETVLVHSAAGGIGQLAVQLARMAGAGLVIGTSSTPEKVDADVAIDYTAADWPDRVAEAAPGGVDVVLDAAGGDVLRRSFGVLRAYGRIVTYGAASGDLIDVPVTDFFALRSLIGFSLLAWRAARPEQARAEMTELAGLLATGQLRAGPAVTLPLSEAAEAHRLLESRAHPGRIMLIP